MFILHVVLEIIFILISLTILGACWLVCVFCLGCNDINVFYPLDNSVKVPTVIRSSTDLTSWEENVREGENHPCSNNNCSLQVYILHNIDVYPLLPFLPLNHCQLRVKIYKFSNMN